MQVANPNDTPSDDKSNALNDPDTGRKAVGLRAKIWEMFELRTISKKAAKQFKDAKNAWKGVPKDLTYHNIKGNESFFYGILWFLHKLSMNDVDLEEGMPSDADLKEAIKDYNSGDHKEEYRDRVWRIYTSGQWKGKTICEAPHGKDE